MRKRADRFAFTRLRPACARLRRGFTLIELLLAISIIGGLSAITIAAINPSRQFAQSRNAQRHSDVKALLDAMQQRMLDEGSLPGPIDTTWRLLGTDTAGCSLTCGQGGTIQVTLNPAADSTLSQAAPATNYGAIVQIQEYPWSPSWSKRGLIHFDLTALPGNALVGSAILRLHEAQAYGVGTQTVALHRMAQNWTEPGVTWNRYDGTSNWIALGGDFSSTATATTNISWTGAVKWDTWNVQSDVQNFLSGTQQNYGWLIKDNVENASQAYWYFDSREAATNRPQLVIDYSVTGTQGGVTADVCIDLTSALAPTYIPAIPTDPLNGSSQKTQYAARVNTNGRLEVRACGVELGEDIMAAR